MSIPAPLDTPLAMLGATRDASLICLLIKVSIPSRLSEAKPYRGVRVRQKQVQVNK